MCGIAGIAALAGGAPATREALSSMCATLHHRGPDEGGCHLGDRVALGVRRLSIIDVEGGHGTGWVAVNSRGAHGSEP